MRANINTLLFRLMAICRAWGSRGEHFSGVGVMRKFLVREVRKIMIPVLGVHALVSMRRRSGAPLLQRRLGT